MATATKQVISETNVMLTISWEEAQTLMGLLGMCSGHPATSRRKHTSAMYDALCNIRTLDRVIPRVTFAPGNIHFEDEQNIR